jgi:hypothetical protein
MSKKSIAKQIHLIEDGIKGVANSPEIQARLDIFGYTWEEMAKGEALLENVKQIISIHTVDYSDQYVATSVLHEKWSEAYSIYMITLKIVRIAFRGQPEMLFRFKAIGARSRSLSGWLNDAHIFYNNLLDTPVALEKISRFGYSVERLKKEQEGVKEIEQLHSLRLSEKGQAQQNTIEKDKMIDELCNWYSDFRAVARIALYDKPQWLESLGIVKK